MKNRAILLCSFCLLGAVARVSGQAPVLTIQIVNDSGVPDANMYVMMSGGQFQVVTGNMPFIDLVNNPTATVTSTALTNLTPTGSVISPVSGRTNTLYTVTMVMGQSCRMFVAESPNLQFTSGAAPTNIENYRFDKFEFDFTDAPKWAGDLTSVDFMSIPMRLEAVDSATGDIFDSRSFYLSQSTMVQQMSALINRYSPGGAGKIIQRDATNGFLRILAPATITGNNTNASPYPSYAGYLQKLAASGYTFNTSHVGQGFGATAPTYVDDNTNTVTVNIPTYTANYSYNGSVVTDGMDGYVINLNGSVSWTPAMPAVYPGGSNTNASTCCTNITVYLPKKLLDQNLYSCPTTMQAYNVSKPSLAFPTNCTTSSAQSSYFNCVLGNSVYSYVLANVQSAINLGYFGGIYGTNTVTWYNTVLPPSIPFGGARKSNDGCYNPYAAMIYGFSDSYGFAYSDRVQAGTNPLIAYQSTNTYLRVTFLPDNMMDAPQVTTGPCMTNSIAVQWSPVNNVPAGFNLNYIINTYPPLPGGPASLTGTYTNLTGLSSGMPYSFSVIANAVTPNGMTTNQSFAIPVQGVTTGTFFAPSTAPYTNQLSPAGWSSGVFSNPANFSVYIGGQLCKYTGAPTNGYVNPAWVGGSATDNFYPVVVQDSNSKTIYQNALQVTMAAGPPMTNSLQLTPSFLMPQAPDLPGTPPLTVAGIWVSGASSPLTTNTVTVPGPFPVLIGPGSPPGPNPPTISFTGAPETFKVVSPVLFPPPTSQFEKMELLRQQKLTNSKIIQSKKNK